jgi:hypothetical protein
MATSESERIVAAERRGWVFEISTEGERVQAVQATLMELDEDDRGAHFAGEGEGALASVLDRVEELDRAHHRL